MTEGSAYVFTPTQYWRDVVSNIDGAAYAHQVGEVVQLQITRPPVEILGRRSGSFGSVYTVRSTADGAMTAIKTPRLDRVRDKRALDEFAREATLWRNLPRHPFVLPALQVFRYDGRPYLEMPFISPVIGSSASLEEILVAGEDSGGLATGLFTLVIGQLLQALAYLEQEVPGFTHGDIKPSNVLLNAPGRILSGAMSIQLSDFGLARAYSEDGIPVSYGDPCYLPIEWLRPNDEYRGPSAYLLAKSQDVYAFGSTALELLLNQRWQACDPVDGVWRTLADRGLTLEGLLQARPDIGQVPLSVIWRCVSAVPRGRWQTFAELARSWHEAMSARPGTISLDLSSWTPLGADFGAEPASRPNGVYEYLLQLGSPPEESGRVAATLWDASQLRAIGRVQESSALLMKIREEFPGLAAAVAGDAQGLALTPNREKESLLLYEHALGIYRADDTQRQLDGLGFAAVCATMAQLMAASADADSNARAVALAQEAVAAEPTVARAHASLGFALMAIGDFERSVEALDRAEQLDRGHSFIRVASRTARGLASGAVFSPVGLDDLNPDQRLQARSLWSRMSPLLRQMERLRSTGEFDAAVRVAAEALSQVRQRRVSGEEAEGLACLAGALLEVGDLERAAVALTDAARAFQAGSRPNKAGDMMDSLGRIRFQQARFADAAAAHREAAEAFRMSMQDYRLARAETNLVVALHRLGRWDEATAASETSALLWGRLGRPKLEAAAWLALGQSHLEAGRAQAAVTPLQKAQALFRASRDEAGTGAALDAEGLARTSLGRQVESLSLHREAASLLTSAGDHEGSLLAKSHLVAALVSEARHEEAIKLAEEVLRRADLDVAKRALASVLNNLGLALAGERRFDEAVEAHHKSALCYERAHDLSAKSLALNNMGRALQLAGQTDRAETAYRAAATLGAALELPDREAPPLLNLGMLLVSLKKYGAGETVLRRAVDCFSASSEDELRGRALHHLGIALEGQANYEDAVDSLERAIEARQHGDRRGLGSSYFQLGMVYRRLGRNREALTALSKDLSISRTIGDPEGEALTLKCIGEVLKNLNRSSESQRMTALAAERYAEVGAFAEQGRLLFGLGNDLAEMGQVKEAEAVLMDAAGALRLAGESAMLSSVLTDLSRLLVGLGRMREALMMSRQAISEASIQGDHVAVGYAQLGLGLALVGAGDTGEQETALKAALAEFSEAANARLVALAAAALEHFRRDRT